jgi:hypothetical protein
MRGILEIETAVNKELQFGELIHQPIIAWAFDMSRAMVEPVPVAVGGHAQFLKNGDSANFQIVPANPGFFQMSYLADRAQLKKLSAEQRSEIKKNAGAFDLGVWTPEDTTDWREAALECEGDIFEDLICDEQGAYLTPTDPSTPRTPNAQQRSQSAQQ